jgi:hypothetical protein
MKKEVIFFILVFTFVLPMASATLSSGMDEIQNYVDQYKTGTISAPQLVVYIEYAKNKIYEELDKEGRNAFTETEIEAVFDKSIDDKNDQRFSQYEKKFLTNDFEVVFRANSFYRYDREYYEQREEDLTNYYTIDYELVAANTESFSDLGSEIRKFISDLKNLVEVNGSADDEELLRKNLNKIKQKVREIEDRDECAELMEDLGMTENEDIFGKDRSFYYVIKEQINERCRNVSKCDSVCEPIEICVDCEPECYDEEVCGEVCEPTEVCEDVCEDVFNNETNQTDQVCDEVCEPTEVCEDVCEMEKVCTGCEDVCETRESCHRQCEFTEQCTEFSTGEIRMAGECGLHSNIHISAWGEGFNRYHGVNKGGEWGRSCDSDIQNHVKLRKVLQKDINNEFAKWYFEEFLIEDYDKMINGDGGFKYVLEILTRNEEKIAQNFHCSENKTWPAGFEKIDITYINENTRVEVWEKNIPVEQDNAEYYTTLYKYSWVPSRELLKGLINYQISETDILGPSAKDVAKIKADAGKMEIVNSLSERYGGSFDVKLELKDKEENVILKYLQINPDVAVKLVDSIEEDPDISIEIEYDVLYDFISYISYEKEAERIYGPRWVHIGTVGGPGDFFGVLGAVSKMWREGITIKPRYALLKLLFNSKSVIQLMQGRVESIPYQGGGVQISSEALSELER